MDRAISKVTCGVKDGGCCGTREVCSRVGLRKRKFPSRGRLNHREEAAGYMGIWKGRTVEDVIVVKIMRKLVAATGS